MEWSNKNGTLLSLSWVQPKKGLAGRFFRGLPRTGSTKHLHLRAVKGHFVHCTEKKGGHGASNASRELQAAPLPNHSPVPESWFAVVIVCMQRRW